MFHQPACRVFIQRQITVDQEQAAVVGSEIEVLFDQALRHLFGRAALAGIHLHAGGDPIPVERVQVLEKNGLRLALPKQDDALAPRHVQNSDGDGTAS